MSNLRTNYTDDVLDATMSGKRQYTMVENDNGTVSFVDETVYTNVGDNFGASDINETNEEVNTLSSNLGDVSEITNPNYSSVSSVLKWYIDNGFLPEVGLIPLVPVMTSDTTPSGEAFASSEDRDYKAFKVFDNTNETYWQAVNKTSGEYVGYRFNNPVTVKNISILDAGSTYGRTHIYLQGSNNGSNWNTIKDITNIQVGVLNNINVNNNTPYSYLRIYDVSGGSSQWNIDLLQFYGY